MYPLHRMLAVDFAGRVPAHHATVAPDDTEILQAALTDTCVLFTSAAPVTSIAFRIHAESGWRWGPFQSVDCGAPDAVLERDLFSVLESDLQGGASTVPTLRLRQPGTLLLNEVGRLSGPNQARLLAVLNARVGSRSRSRRRIMASTSEFLLARVNDGTFDSTLFYRLNVIHFVLRASR